MAVEHHAGARGNEDATRGRTQAGQVHRGVLDSRTAAQAQQPVEQSRPEERQTARFAQPWTVQESTPAIGGPTPVLQAPVAGCCSSPVWVSWSVPVGEYAVRGIFAVRLHWSAYLVAAVVVGQGMIKVPCRPAVLTAAAIALSVGTVTSTPAMAATSILTNASNGQAIAATTGDAIKVQLTSEQGQGLKWTWSRPTSSDQSVVRPSGSAMSPDGSASGTFEVQDTGSATISAVESCTATTPDAQCPATVKTWTVAVSAVGA